MRIRNLVLATSAIVLAAPALAQTPPPPPVTGTAPAAAASCQPGELEDGTYQATERERRNRGNRPNRRQAQNDDADQDADMDDGADADAADAGDGGTDGTGITEVTLTWQCGGTGPGGSYIPAGYKVEVRGECPSGTCDLGTTVAIGAKGGNQFGAFLDDETVGLRELRFQSRRNRIMLQVRTQIEGQRRPAQARYMLSLQ